MTLLIIYHNNIDTVFISPSLRGSARVDYGTMQLASVLKTSAGEGLTIQSADKYAPCGLSLHYSSSLSQSLKHDQRRQRRSGC